jgi:hypothetical protein
MVSFFLLLSDLVGEKEQRLRLGLQLMGARGSAYWLSWFVWSIVMNSVANAVLILSGFAFQISFFTNTNIFVLFFLFGSFGLSCVCMAMGCRYIFLHTHYLQRVISPPSLPPSFLVECSAMINSQRTAQTVGYAVVLIGFVFQSVLQSGYGCVFTLQNVDDCGISDPFFFQCIDRLVVE